MVRGSEEGRRVLVTGANRGLGLEFVRQYAAAGWEVIATCRDVDAASELALAAAPPAAIRVHALDVRDASMVDALAGSIGDAPLDLLVNNAGVYGRKRLPLEAVEVEEWIDVLHTNTIAPLLVTRALLRNLEAARGAVVAMLSSKVGSIADNTSGGNYAYRTSKAALNQVVKNLALELAPSGIRVVALHPGWVMTDMGGPGALIDVGESVAGMRAVIDGVEAEDSGRFLGYRGESIPW